MTWPRVMSSIVSDSSFAEPGTDVVERCFTFIDTGSPEMVGDGVTAAEDGGALGTVREHPATAKPIIVMAVASGLIGFTAANLKLA